MKKVAIGLVIVAVLVGIVAASLRPKGEKGDPVYASKATKGRLLATVRATGKIAPLVKVSVSAEISGRIATLHVREGDRVAAGDPLVTLDPGPYAKDVERLEAAVRMSEIAVREQEVALRDAEATLGRRRELHGSGLVSREEYERVSVAAESAKVRIEQAREQVTQARAGVDKAKDELAKCRLTSPISGIVTELNAEKGESVVTGLMNNPGTVIMVVSDMSQVMGEFSVDEHDVTSVKAGQVATVEAEALTRRELPGKVSEIGQSAVKQQLQDVSTFTVKVMLDVADEALRPGMSARATIETAARDDALQVPIQAVLTGEGGKSTDTGGQEAPDAGGQEAPDAGGQEAPDAGGDDAPDAGDDDAPSTAAGEPGAGAGSGPQWVFVVEGGKARKAIVTTGISNERMVEILSGVTEGQQVITGPYRKLKDMKDGAAVRIEQTDDEKEKAKEKKKEGVKAAPGDKKEGAGKEGGSDASP